MSLPNPAAREAKRQETLRLRKQVQALARRGKEISEIAAELGVESEVVAPIYAKIADKMRASGSRGRDGAGDSAGSLDNQELIKLVGGERLLRLTEARSGLSLEKKLDPSQPVVRQKKQMLSVFEAALTRAQFTPA